MDGPTRLIYVEDDPALRGILGTVLSSRPELSLLGSFGTSADALEFVAENRIDAALLDFNLGGDPMNGVDLGLSLRHSQPDLGIVILTQHQVPEFLTRLQQSQRVGWSFILKRADLQPRYLADVLVGTSRGLTIVDPAMASRSDDGAISRLTPRQRLVMSLAARGLDANSIAAEIGIKPAAARQELSRAYAVLVPEPPSGADIRTLAVLTWLREAQIRAPE